MLNNMVSPIDHVVMNHQNQTRTNGIWGHVRYTDRLGRPVQPPRRVGQTARAGLTAQGGQSDCPGRSRREASKRRTRDMIARVALVLCRLAVDVHPPNGVELKTSEIALEGLVSLVASKGSLVFWLPPYKHLSCGTETNSWNPSSFPFAFPSSYFP
jgi:hypothetical protein